MLQGRARMKLHGNARTCPHSRLLMVRRVEEEGSTRYAGAEAAGVSVRTVSKWLACWRADGEQVLSDGPGLRARPSSHARAAGGDDRGAAALGHDAAEIAECLSIQLRRSAVLPGSVSVASHVSAARGAHPLRATPRGRASHRCEEARPYRRRRPSRDRLPQRPGAGNRLLHIAIDDADTDRLRRGTRREEGHA